MACTSPPIRDRKVMLITRYFDDVLDDGSKNIHKALGGAAWAAKMLTLDQPGDVRRYAVPSEALRDEVAVRALLARRVDFSKDAVARVKITMI